MNNKTLYLFALTLILCQNLLSQTIYKPGYVLTTENDTISGFILDKSDYELTKQISFKEGIKDSNIVEYTTTDLLGFRFDSGRIFQRVQAIETNETSKDTIFVFAKRIVKGKIDLLVWRHKNLYSYDFFIINKHSQREAQLTRPKKIKVEKDGKEYSKKDKRYQHLLNYVKGIKKGESKKNKTVNYGEKPIIKDIMSYNNKYEEEYTSERYKETFKYGYNILVGMPIKLNSAGTGFRIGVYNDKTYIEKSKRLSLYRGIVYNHYKENDEWGNYFHTGTHDYSWDILNIIPVGLKIQGKSKKIIPYGYIGVGVGFVQTSYYKISDYEISGSEKEFTVIPTVNVGVGAKIRVKSNFILAEFTPTGTGIYFNVGYSF